jgi:hypothetical protein
MLMPLLSEADPKISAEGSIDPLGTYSIADALAIRMIPGVRERQQHPRFLTCVAVSLSICSRFPDETVADDEISEPWQVFEWYVVEGLVRNRTMKEKGLLRGLPGQDKAAAAIKDGVPLSAKRYLKTPTVFGFHGIYRALARDLDVERAGRLGETGYALVTTWEKEQQLEGFSGSCDGAGKPIRQQLVDAIRDGLQSGGVARKAGWSGWQFFSDHLGIYGAGHREARVITQALLDPGSGFRKEVLQFLVSKACQRLLEEEENWSERKLHAALAEIASPDLKELLWAIDAYEQFCRLIQDAFDDVLFQLSRHQTRIPPIELVRLRGVRQAIKKVPDIFTLVTERLSPFGEENRFHETFSSLAERVSEVEWLERLLEHHRRVQSEKPPAGKAPWFDRFEDGSYMIRTGYIRDVGGQHNDSYVHAYRTASLLSFAQDLRLVK